MVCYHPLQAWRSQSGRNRATGKWPLTFKKVDGYSDMEVQVPCGQCVGCRLERSRQWAMRCVQEASLYEDNCFITLTFSDEFLYDLSLHKEDYVKFMKRLRKKYGSNIRFFHCGEYGSLLSRPHHHAILFNFDFPDKKFFIRRNGVNLYRSYSLERLWPFGHSTIGECTFESAAYVARYVLKKVTGDQAPDHYKGREPEYVSMSRKPGIAREWFDKYYKDVYSIDSVVMPKPYNNSYVMHLRPPKYFDSIYDEINPEHFKSIKRKRTQKAKEHALNNTPYRLEVREQCQSLKLKKLVRPIEM